MIYKNFKDLKLSALGMGCMRLPVDADGVIDEKETARIIAYAMEHGINYYDTAWPYHGGNSELVMGRVLSAYPRESFYLATKFPGYDPENLGKVEEIFEKQLEKTGAGYFDFYLIHNVCESDIEGYLNPSYGMMDYFLKQKKNGRIRHLGFSTHAGTETFLRFLDAYGEHMEFCQIQLNWLDYDFQDAKTKVEILNERKIPIWIMEPLRGGRLVNLAEEDVAALKSLRPEETVPAWSFRYLQSIPGVTVVLSGMSTFSQMADNVKTYETEEPLSAEECDVLYRIAKKMTASVPCTACRYCIEKCPQGLNIPELISHYNDYVFTKRAARGAKAISKLDENKRPSACIGCRGCESVCPQNIAISEIMQELADSVEE